LISRRDYYGRAQRHHSPPIEGLRSKFDFHCGDNLLVQLETEKGQTAGVGFDFATGEFATIVVVQGNLRFRVIVDVDKEITKNRKTPTGT
jgi:hypothetical protein